MADALREPISVVVKLTAPIVLGFLAATAAAQSPELHRLPPLETESPTTVEEAYPWWLSQQPGGLAPPGNPLTPASDGAPVRPAGYDLPLATPLVEENSPLNDAPKIDQARTGVFQKLTFNATWLPGGSVSDFGMSDFELAATFAFPTVSRDRPLILTPGFDVHYLDGPDSPDLPPSLYEAWLKIRTMGKINDRWGYDMAVTPGWHSDFDNASGKALRITGYAFAAYTWSEQLQLLMGVMYLDRTNLRLLPAAGLIWKPDDDTRVELTAPRPRYAKRFYADPGVEHWWYVAGELGGGTWAIEEAGTATLMSYSDYRILLGWERKTAGGIGTVAELGYVFGRQISFQDGPPTFDPTSTLMLRFGASY